MFESGPRDPHPLHMTLNSPFLLNVGRTVNMMAHHLVTKSCYMTKLKGFFSAVIKVPNQLP